MKTPIEPSEIRKGDLIRLEGGNSSLAPQAVEYVARRDADRWSIYHEDRPDVSYFLLGRSTPPVDVPTEPTLGFVTSAAGGRASPAIAGLSPNFSPVGGTDRIYVRAGDPFAWDFETHISAFTPATAVPTKALHTLRLERQAAHDIPLAAGRASRYAAAISNFLAAVDEANR